MTDFVDVPDCTQVFIQRHPNGPLERLGGVESFKAGDFDARLNLRPDWLKHMKAAQTWAGWSEDELQRNWAAFCSYPIVHLMDHREVAIAFHAVTAMYVVIWLARAAWEQHNQ